MRAIVRDGAFAAVMEYLADPTLEDPEKQEELRDYWGKLGDRGYFLYSQDEKILSAVRDMTAAGSITWVAEQYSDGERYFGAEIGVLLYVSLKPIQAQGPFSAVRSYIFAISSTADEPFWPEVKLGPGPNEQHRPLWLIADEIHALISKTISDDEVRFNKIVRDNIVHDILSSLDSPRS